MNPKLVKRGIPGMVGAFILCAGMSCWWCRNAEIAAIMLGLLVLAGAFSTAMAVGLDQ